MTVFPKVYSCRDVLSRAAIPAAAAVLALHGDEGAAADA